MTAEIKRLFIISGSTRGLGKSLAQNLAKVSFEIWLMGRDTLALDGVAESLSKNCVTRRLPGDLSQESYIDHVKIALQDRLKYENGLSSVVLINNAGFLEKSPLEKLDEDLLLRHLRINLFAPFALSKALIGAVKGTQLHTKIINVSSLAGVAGVQKFPGLLAYSVSKAALNGLTESLHAEVVDLPIDVVGLCLGAMDTDMLKKAGIPVRPQLKVDDLAIKLIDIIENQSSIYRGTNIVFENERDPWTP